MKLIKLIHWDTFEFKKELKNIDFNQNKNIELNEQLSKHIEIFFNFLIRNNIVNINLFKSSNIDILCQRIVKNYFYSNFIKVHHKINFKFSNFEESELLEFIDYPLYFYYCSKNNIEVIHNKTFYAYEMKKVAKNYRLCILYRNELKVMLKYLKKYPYTSFNFPLERNKDRFVLYFYVYSEERKIALIELLKQLNINMKEVYDYIEKIKIYDTIAGYGLGFSYVNKRLIRFTLYTAFVEPLEVKKNIDFINQLHNLNLDYSSEEIWNYGIDFYFKDNGIVDYEEIKVYFSNHRFIKKLKSRELDAILRNKSSIKVLKFRNNIQINEKYEFLLEFFSKKERRVLRKYKLYKDTYTTVSIYLDKDGNITNVVKYLI